MASGTAGGRIAPGVGANLIGQHSHDRNQDATVYVGNLDPQMSEELVWELFTQGGPVANVYLPKDRVTNQHMGYGFVEFRSEEDADYAIRVLNMIKIFGKPIRVNKSSQDKRTSTDVGANMFIGNLDPDVDEKLLYDTFSAFGMIVATPKIMRDPETGASRGFGFVSYDSFEASDAAIEAMHGQFLCNRAITVSYAFKKDAKGERHGTPNERLLAEQNRARLTSQNRPNTLFATGPKQRPEAVPEGQQLLPPLAPGPPSALAPPPPPMANGGYAPPMGSQPLHQGPPAASPHLQPGYGQPQQPGAHPPWGQMGSQPPPAGGGLPPPPPMYGQRPPPGMPPPPAQHNPMGAPPGYQMRPPQGMPPPPAGYGQAPPRGMPPPPMGYQQGPPPGHPMYRPPGAPGPPGMRPPMMQPAR